MTLRQGTGNINFLSLADIKLAPMVVFWLIDMPSWSMLICFGYIRPAQLAELPRSKFDPELFPHSAYVKIVVTFATKGAVF